MAPLWSGLVNMFTQMFLFSIISLLGVSFWFPAGPGVCSLQQACGVIDCPAEIWEATGHRFMRYMVVVPDYNYNWCCLRHA